MRQPNGFYLFRAEEVTYRPLSQARDEIFGAIKQQHYTEWLDKANKDCRASRSNSASKVPVDRRRSSRVSKAEPDRKAEPDNLDKANLDRANKACLASRNNSASKVLVDRRRSSKANKAEPGQAPASLAPDKAPPVSQVDPAGQVDQASKSSSASRVLAASPS